MVEGASGLPHQESKQRVVEHQRSAHQGQQLRHAAATTTEAMDGLEVAYRTSIQSGDERLLSGVELGLALGYSHADVAAWLINARRR